MAHPIDTATGLRAGDDAFFDEPEAEAQKPDPLDVRHAEDVKWLLAHAQGRRLMWRYLSVCGVFHETFSTDALRMARSEGRRSVGLELLADVMSHAPTSYVKMMEEASASK